MIVAAVSLVDVRSVIALFRVDRVEGGLTIVAFIDASVRPYRTELGDVPACVVFTTSVATGRPGASPGC